MVKLLLLTPDEQQTAVRLIQTALEEDLRGQSDITSQLMIPETARGSIRIVSRRPGVLAGGVLIPLVMQQLDPCSDCSELLPDGSRLQSGTVIARLSGSLRTLLTAERTILNFMTLLSGVATLTQEYVAATEGTRAQILDTRKTLPGLRALQKYAVRCGGGTNHRIGLYDAVLVKDNHLAYYQQQHGGSLAEAAQRLRQQAPPGMTIEFEVDSLSQLEALLPGQPDIVLLDNMDVTQLREAVHLRDQLAPGVLTEASGGIHLRNVAEISRTGVDRISVGALTHSAPALDIGFDWDH